MKRYSLVLVLMLVGLVGCSSTTSIKCSSDNQLGNQSIEAELFFNKEDVLTKIVAKDTFPMENLNLGDDITEDQYKEQITDYYESYSEEAGIQAKITFDDGIHTREVTKEYGENFEYINLSWSLSSVPNENTLTKDELIKAVESIGLTCQP